MNTQARMEGEEWLNPHEHYYYQCYETGCVYQVDVFSFLDCEPHLQAEEVLTLGRVSVRIYTLPDPTRLNPALEGAEAEVLVPPSGVPQVVSVRLRSTRFLERGEVEELRWRVAEVLCGDGGLLRKR